jgi:hypothetical protein
MLRVLASFDSHDFLTCFFGLAQMLHNLLAQMLHNLHRELLPLVKLISVANYPVFALISAVLTILSTL